LLTILCVAFLTVMAVSCVIVPIGCEYILLVHHKRFSYRFGTH